MAAPVLPMDFNNVRKWVQDQYKLAINHIDESERLCKSLATLVNAENGQAPKPAASSAPPRPKKASTAASQLSQEGKGTTREMVKQAMVDWITVEKLAKATGIKPVKVRGVLNARDLKDHIEKRQGAEKVTEYKWV